MSELQKYQLAHIQLPTFLFNQLLLHFAVVWVWLIGLVALCFAKNFVKFRCLGITYFIVLLLFIFSKGKDYYMMGMYPVLFSFGAVTMIRIFTNRLYFINYVILAHGIIFGCLLAPLGLPLLPLEKLDKYCQLTSKVTGPDFNRWEDGLIHKIPQDFADMAGWKELTGIVYKAYHQLNVKDRTHCTLYGEN
jgi:hypothetical protein